MTPLNLLHRAESEAKKEREAKAKELEASAKKQGIPIKKWCT